MKMKTLVLIAVAFTNLLSVSVFSDQQQAVTILKGYAPLIFSGTADQARDIAYEDLESKALRYCTDKNFVNYHINHLRYNIDSGVSGYMVFKRVKARAQVVCTN